MLCVMCLPSSVCLFNSPRQCTDAIWALITGVGELWASFIFQQYLIKTSPQLTTEFLNARDVIVAEDTIVGKEVNFSPSSLDPFLLSHFVTDRLYSSHVFTF